MINVNTINKYLEANNLPPNKGYLLKDNGEGEFIARWDLEIPEPTEQDLVKAKNRHEQSKGERVNRRDIVAEARNKFQRDDIKGTLEEILKVL